MRGPRVKRGVAPYCRLAREGRACRNRRRSLLLRTTGSYVAGRPARFAIRAEPAVPVRAATDCSFAWKAGGTSCNGVRNARTPTCCVDTCKGPSQHAWRARRAPIRSAAPDGPTSVASRAPRGRSGSTRRSTSDPASPGPSCTPHRAIHVPSTAARWWSGSPQSSPARAGGWRLSSPTTAPSFAPLTSARA
jgi:hypothetical protein